MLSGITITCFAASYLVALALEVVRLFFRAPVRTALSLGFMAAGLLAHTLYLAGLAQEELTAGVIFSSWYDWCLMAAWVLSAAYLGLSITRSQSSLGVFMLPLVLVLVGTAWLARGMAPFPVDKAHQAWGMVHGILLLLGTTGMAIGFAAALMYLVQSYRLKHKLAPSQKFSLPSLEWLERFNSRSLILSTCLLTGGVASGIVLNLVADPKMAVRWTDPAILTSGLLVVWLLVALAFESIYRPARQGRKVAYLNLAGFVILGLVLGIVLFVPSGHARGESHPNAGARRAGQPAAWLAKGSRGESTAHGGAA